MVDLRSERAERRAAGRFLFPMAVVLTLVCVTGFVMVPDISSRMAFVLAIGLAVFNGRIGWRWMRAPGAHEKPRVSSRPLDN